MKTIQFYRWAVVLWAFDLPQQICVSYVVTLHWYLSWCRRNGVGCSFESARDFIAWAAEEKQAKEWAVERWREPLRWFFRTAKAQAALGVELEGTG